VIGRSRIPTRHNTFNIHQEVLSLPEDEKKGE